jgi:hypothetical protein
VDRARLCRRAGSGDRRRLHSRATGSVLLLCQQRARRRAPAGPAGRTDPVGAATRLAWIAAVYAAILAVWFGCDRASAARGLLRAVRHCGDAVRAARGLYSCSPRSSCRRSPRGEWGADAWPRPGPSV